MHSRDRAVQPTDLKPYLFSLSDVQDELGSVLDWPTLFGNGHPVEIDVGCARGLFLVSSAEANPHVNYLGIETDCGKSRHSAQRLKRRQLSNVRVLRGDARIALGQMISPHSVAAIHVYFPDPWWKRKHRRRRVFTNKFVGLCAKALKPGGLLHSWTDVAEYFEVIAALMNHDPRFEALPPPEEQQPAHDMDYQTSFERKKRKTGQPIHRGCWKLRDP